MRILLLSPSTKPSETLFCGLQYRQWRGQDALRVRLHGLERDAGGGTQGRPVRCSVRAGRYKNAVRRGILLYVAHRAAARVKEIERTTRHDVKALEYYVKEQLRATSLADVAEFVQTLK